MNKSARRRCSGKDERGCGCDCDGQCERLADVLSGELFSSCRQKKSFSVNLALRTQFLSGANFFSRNFQEKILKLKPKMREISQHAGFPARLRDG